MLTPHLSLVPGLVMHEIYLISSVLLQVIVITLHFNLHLHLIYTSKIQALSHVG